MILTLDLKSEISGFLQDHIFGMVCIEDADLKWN